MIDPNLQLVVAVVVVAAAVAVGVVNPTRRSLAEEVAAAAASKNDYVRETGTMRFLGHKISDIGSFKSPSIWTLGLWIFEILFHFWELSYRTLSWVDSLFFSFRCYFDFL